MSKGVKKYTQQTVADELLPLIYDENDRQIENSSHEAFLAAEERFLYTELLECGEL